MTRVLGADRVPAGFTITTEACVAYLRDGGAPRRARGAGRRGARTARARRRQAARRPRRPAAGLGPLGCPRLDAGDARHGAQPRARRRGGRRSRRSADLGSRASPGTRTGGCCRCSATWSAGSPAGEFEDALGGLATEAGASVDTDLDAERPARALRALQARSIADAGDPLPAGPPRRSSARRSSPCSSPGTARGRASYRRLERIPDDWGTAVNVQRMAFGNRGETSGSGVAFSRNETTGAPEPSGDFLANSQGEDVVAGIRNTEGLDGLARAPARGPRRAARGARDARAPLRRHAGRRVHGRGRASSSCSRRGPPSARPRPRCASPATRSTRGCSTARRRWRRSTPSALEALLHPTFDPEDELRPSSPAACPASPGAAQGAIVFTRRRRRCAGGRRRGRDPRAPVHRGRRRRRLPRRPRDPHRGGRQVLARGPGRARDGEAVRRGRLGARDRRRRRGRPRSARPSCTPATRSRSTAPAGLVTVDEVELIVPADQRRVRARARVGRRDPPAGRAGQRRQRRGRRARARRSAPRESASAAPSTCSSARTARSWSARCSSPASAGGGRRRGRPTSDEVERAETAFREALDRLGELQRADFAEIFRAMAGLPVTVRLLDPPLHEFLPVSHFEAALEEAGEEGEAADEARARLALARELEETNPMLGLRGAPARGHVRRGLRDAGAGDRRGDARGRRPAASGPTVEIMLPLIAYETELALVREMIVRAVEGDARVAARSRVAVRDRDDDRATRGRAWSPTGSRATPTSSASAPTTSPRPLLGLSRDDAEGGFLNVYLERGLIDRSPFESLDTPGVGSADRDRRRARGRGARPDAPARDLRRARGRPGEHPLLRAGRARLRQLLSLPGADRPGRRSPGGARGGDVAALAYAPDSMADPHRQGGDRRGRANLVLGRIAR